ncbi:MAG: GtrA family protein [Patescibacteria group bacterium]|nr:GtrA family protein [Patescibacteria group bacterium]
MKKIDIILALVCGEVIAWFSYGILRNLGVEIKFLSLILVISFPILTLFGLWIVWFLGRKFLWIFQAAKFLLIGAVATLVDLGVLNLLISVSGFGRGLFYSIFKAISFIFATCSKYLGDKFWAFEKMERNGMGKEFSQFFLVTLIGLGINVGAASLIVNLMGPQFGLTEKLWANIGAILAAFISAVWNFIGYKFIVFKK